MKSFRSTVLGTVLGALLCAAPLLGQAKTPDDQLIVGMSMANLFSIDPANAPENPYSPQPVRNLGLGLVLELVVTPVLCLWQTRIANAYEEETASRSLHPRLEVEGRPQAGVG